MGIDNGGRLITGNSGFTTTSAYGSTAQYLNLHIIGGAGTNNGGGIFIARNTPSTNAANQDLGNIYWGTNDGAPFARIGAWAEGTPTASSYPGYLSIQTTPSGSTSPIERVRVSAGGTVLFNTSTPEGVILKAQGTSWGGGNASATNSGRSDPQFIFDGVGLDNSGSVTPVGFQIRGGGGGVPRGYAFGAYGSYQGASASGHNMFFVRNIGNNGQPWNSYNDVPGVGGGGNGTGPNNLTAGGGGLGGGGAGGVGPASGTNGIVNTGGGAGGGGIGPGNGGSGGSGIVIIAYPS